MKQRPINLTERQIRAILDNNATQIRRAIVPVPHHFVVQGLSDDKWYDADGVNPGKELRCPFGKPGEHLWVREEWSTVSHNGVTSIIYAADDKPEHVLIEWKSAGHMARCYARIVLKVVSVRAERLKCAKLGDFNKEGFNPQFSWTALAIRELDRTSPVPCNMETWTWVAEVERVIDNPSGLGSL